MKLAQYSSPQLPASSARDQAWSAGSSDRTDLTSKPANLDRQFHPAASTPSNTLSRRPSAGVGKHVRAVLKTTLIAIASILAVVGLIAVGVLVAAPSLIGSVLGGDPVETESESTISEVTHAVERREEVVLVALSQQGIETTKVVQTVWGIEIPGSDRALFVQYSFTAKLGIDGSAVRIKHVDPKTFTISVPTFKLIGFDDFKSSVAVEQNGVLSWATPEIDQTKMTERVLSGENKQKLVQSNLELLKRQTESFYGGIVRAIDPDIDLRFQFAVSG